MPFPIAPPIEPMLVKIAEHLPPDGDFLFEPKWDGFRAIVTRMSCRALIGVGAIAGLLVPTAAYAAGDAEPQLPNPQWRTSPQSPSSAPARGKSTSPTDVESSSDTPRATIPPPELPAQPASFEERCAEPGVVLCDPLDEGRVRGPGITGRTANATLPDALKGRYRNWRWCGRRGGVTPQTPVFEDKVKTSGSGALKFVVPTRSAAGDAGHCQINFTPDNSVQFGEGDTFFVQFRVRLSCTLLFTDCDPVSEGYKKERRVFRSTGKGGTNFKVSIINAGDHPDLPFPVSSCTAQHLVLVQGPNGIVAGYHSCGWYDGYAMKVGQERGSALWDSQPKKTARPCVSRRGSEASPDCVVWPADEWVTITQQVTIGKWASKSNDPARSSNVRIWMQRQGEQPVLVIDYDRNLKTPEKPFMKYGKIWLLPYMTNKDPLEEHPEAYMWFDELIVSRAPIAPALD